MSKPRKMLCDLEAPYTQSLMRLIERQLYYGARKAGSATTPRAAGGLPGNWRGCTLYEETRLAL